MTVTIPYVKSKFDEYNRLIFKGQLPSLPIELSDAKTFIGACVYKTRTNLFGKKTHYDFKLRINTRIDLPENVIEDTIIHEMIHYYIAYNQMKDSSAHGSIFKKIMNDINRAYGRHISISHRGTKEQREQSVDTRRHWHVVALMSMADGRCGIKVLPRVLPSILTYYNAVGMSKDVAGIQLFMSDDVYFNRFPNSKSLYFHFVDRDEVTQHLQGAERLECDGKTIIRNKVK